MNANDAVSQLKTLCQNADSQEIIVGASRDFYDIDDYAAMKNVQNEWLGIHRAIVEELSRDWGTPHTTSPEALETIAFAAWTLNNKIVFVALRHDDAELPFLLVIGFATK